MRNCLILSVHLGGFLSYVYKGYTTPARVHNVLLVQSTDIGVVYGAHARKFTRMVEQGVVTPIPAVLIVICDRDQNENEIKQN